MTPYPIIRDINGEFSDCCCPPKAGIKEAHRIRHELPPQRFLNNDPQILQDEFGAPILDELTAGFIYDDWRNF